MNDRIEIEATSRCVSDFDHAATIVDRVPNFYERLFFEAWYSQRDSKAGNEHIDIPDVYRSHA